MPWSVFVLTFTLGALATVAQVLLLREALVVLDGNELSLVVSLAAWLLGVGLGATGGGIVADRMKRPERLAVAASLATALLLPVSMVMVRHTRELLDVAAGAMVPPLEAAIFCLAALVPVSLGVGLSFAPLVRAAKRRSSLDEPASWVYAIEAAGAVVSGLLVSLVLVGRAPSFVISGLAGGLSAFAGLWVASSRRLYALALAAAVVAFGLVLAGPAGWLVQLEAWSSEVRWQSLGVSARRVAHDDSPYQHLDLAESDGQHTLFSNGSPLLSFPDPWDRVAPVHVAMTQPLQAPSRVLLLGGGVPDRLAAVLEHGPDRVDYVELDPAELQILRRLLPLQDRVALQDERVHVHYTDGRRFVSQLSPRSYNLILVEAPDPLTARANRYFTVEFHRACVRSLRPGGVLATRIGGAWNALATEAGAPAATLFRSLVEIFGEVALWPGQTVHMYASVDPGVVTDDVDELARRFSGRNGDIESWSRERFTGLIPRSDAARRALESGPTMANTDSRPVAYLYGLALWEQRARGASEPSPLWGMVKLETWWLLLPLFVLALLRLLLRRRPRSLAVDGLWAVMTGGFVGLALEVLLLLVYQNIAGSLYQALGLLVGVFMGGLAIGSVVSRRLCRRRDIPFVRSWARLVDLATIVVALAALAVPIAGDQAAWLAGLCLGLVGFCTGATFPPAVVLIAAGIGEGNGGRPAGLADAADHFGACLGAVVIGLVVLPVGGLHASVLLVVGLKAVSLSGLVRRVVSPMRS